jgi:hypothetical protein
MSDVLSYAAWQRLRCAVRFFFRLARYRGGWRPPDARDDGLKYRWALLRFRARVIRDRLERERQKKITRLPARRGPALQQEASR